MFNKICIFYFPLSLKITEMSTCMHASVAVTAHRARAEFSSKLETSYMQRIRLPGTVSRGSANCSL